MSRLRMSLKWLYPGMRVKRWVSLGFAGLLVFMAGMGVIIQTHQGLGQPLAVRMASWLLTDMHIDVLRPGHLGVLLTLVGAGVCFFAMGKLIQSLTSVLDPEMAPGGLVDVVYQKRKLTQGRRIVVIGGGTGLSTMLRGLKRYSANITAIVTVADDGGSSGRLQKQLNILPPGDIRNCLVALADAEPQMTELFQYRFRNSVKPEENRKEEEKKRRKEEEPALPTAQRSTLAAGGVPNGQNLPDSAEASPTPRPKIQNQEGYGEGLRDHAFGNLLIAAMCAINDGDFERGVQETSRVLNVRGKVLPTTVDHVRLRGEMEDGSFVDGETSIAHSPLKIKRVSLVPEDACPLQAVLDAIAKADIIVLGPGSVYTSIIPNLLVRGVPEALKRSKAKKVYVCNVMTQPGETDGFAASDHVHALEMHARMKIFNHVLVNTRQPDSKLLEKYRKTGSVLVEPDIDRLKADGYRTLPGDYINETDVVRHDAGLLATAIMRLLDD